MIAVVHCLFLSCRCPAASAASIPPSLNSAVLQALVASAILLSLPPYVRVLNIGIPCGGPVLDALQHREQLQQLTITGNAAGVLWNSRAAPAVLPKLHSLRLHYQRKDAPAAGLAWDLFTNPDWLAPQALALAEASQLTHLDLSARWDDSAEALCRVLPALHSLR